MRSHRAAGPPVTPRPPSRTRVVAGVVAIGVSCLLAVVSPAPFTPHAAAQTAQSLTVSPSTGLTDGQMVSATGSGFTRSAQAAYGQCPASAATINDESVLISLCSNIHDGVAVDAQGGIAFSTFVLRRLASGVDCAAEACIILARGRFTSDAASAPITFQPGPIIEPHLTVAPDVGLANSQDVTASGTGFTPNLGIQLLQCSASVPSTADQVTLYRYCADAGYPPLDAQGAFVVPFHVAKVGRTTAGTTLVCGTSPGDCVLFAPQLLSGRTARAPLSFAQPPVVVECAVGSGSTPALTIKVNSFPANETFLLFTAVETSNGFDISQGASTTTDASGAASAPPVGISGVPSRINFALYRDTDPNSRWDPGTDDTLFHGQATVSSCPQTVTAAPK